MPQLQTNPTFATVMRIAFPDIPFTGNGLTYASLKATSATPLPSEADLIAAIPVVQAELARRRKIKQLYEQYEATLAQGFVSNATGVPHKYSTSTDFRVAVIGFIVAHKVLGVNQDFPLDTLDAGEILHTPQQVIQLFFDGLHFLTTEYTKFQQAVKAL